MDEPVHALLLGFRMSVGKLHWLAVGLLGICSCVMPEDEDSGNAGLHGSEPGPDAAIEESAPDAPVGPCIEAVDGPNRDAENLAKYWRYRDRLRREFIFLSPDDEPGSNLAAGFRHGETLEWGDTTIMHAQYLAMLATEYAILHGRDDARAEQTARELHWALRALDRLDRRAESYFRANRSEQAGDLNGFFIRDDVEANFLENHPIEGASSVGSDIVSPYGGKPGYFATEMSQDQVWHLTLGLALVKRVAPFVGNIDGEAVDLRAHAKAITARILGYMRNHDRWRTQNPIFDVDVLRGAESDARRVFSYGFAEAGNFILSADAPGDPSYSDLHNTASRLAQPFFRLASTVESDNYNQRVLATVGDINYATGLFDVGGTLWKLEHETISRSLYRYEHFPLAFMLLHGGATRIDETIYGGLLNAAPSEGPFNHGDPTNSCAWASPSRLIWPEYNEGVAWTEGEYNGIDYLLLHNLYQLTYNTARLDELYTPSR